MGRAPGLSFVGPRGSRPSRALGRVSHRYGLLNLDNLRRREWAPAVEASGIATPARIYDPRSSFASDALAAGVPVFTLAKIIGTSVRMIERHYVALLVPIRTVPA